MTTTPSTASQTEHETIVRQGDTLTCTACGTSAKAASQAPSVSIDTPEFLDLACKFAHESSCEEFNEVEYNSARAALVAHINAKLEQTRAEGFEEMRQAMAESAKLMANACRRATAAEAKLEAIRQGAEGLQEYSPAFKVIGGMAKSNDGGWLCKEELLALLQPQHQADESGFPG